MPDILTKVTPYYDYLRAWRLRADEKSRRNGRRLVIAADFVNIDLKGFRIGGTSQAEVLTFAVCDARQNDRLGLSR
jgi:hypothetical protein